MPSSEFTNIPLILQYAKCQKPTSILDVGVGCGKYGMLFREYLDGHWFGKAFHNPSTWSIRMIGVEVFAEYITPVHAYLYTDIWTGDFNEILPSIHERFDMILFGDVLEHFEKEKALQLVRDCKRILADNGSIVISTPNFDTNLTRENGVFGNIYECHRCRLSATDFDNLGYSVQVDSDRLLTVFLENK
jgi:SAM-dependent methyltransferase